MKKNLFALTPIFLLFLFTSCSHSQSPIPKGIYKLEGLWEMKSDEGTTFEQWEINPDGTLQGKDFSIGLKNDTIFYEYLKIIQQDSDVYYVATVLNQNDEKPVYFKLIEFTPMVFVFENKQHDFPQMITYSIKTDDLYAVIIEGPDNGKIKSIGFRFNRKK
ncbi:MAG: DUF6265 family protein [Ignavibacteriae bacterium]|nr:DUF6265 family protein [Ignavibacteriota bacterium]